MSTERTLALSQPWQKALQGFRIELGFSDRSAATVDGYCLHLVWLAEALPDADPWQLSTGQLEQWIGRQNWSEATRGRVLVSLRAFFRFGITAGRVGQSPVVGLGRARRRPGPRRRPLPSSEWSGAIGDFLVSLRASGRREGTIELRRYHLTAFAEHHAHPWQVTTDELTRYLSPPDWQAENRRAHRSSLRTFYRWAYRTRRTEEDPAEVLPSVLVSRGLPRPIPTEALQVAVLRADGRQRLALLLATYAGFRLAEVAGMEWSDVLGDDVLVRGKGGDHRLVPLHPDLRSALAAERGRRRQGLVGDGFGRPDVQNPGLERWVFPGNGGGHLTPNRLGQIMRCVLPQGWTMHTCRHRFASQVYRHERDLRAVQELLGHAKPETTARYAAVPDDARRSAVLSIGL